MHTIHLRDHWTITPLPDGRVRQARSFGAPRTLDPGETIWLTGTAAGEFTATFNGQSVIVIGVDHRFEIALTHGLQPRNQIHFVMASDLTVCDVAIEFRDSTR